MFPSRPDITAVCTLLVLLAAPVHTQQPARFKQDLHALTAPEMAGRGVGTRGGERAMAYIEKAFREIGLRAPCRSGYRQWFTAVDPRPGQWAEETRLSIDTGDDRMDLELGREAVPMKFSADGAVRGRVFFAGYGIVAKERGWDDYSGIDVGGATVLVLRGRPPSWPRDRELRKHLLFTTKVQRAVERGAVAVLLCNARPPAGEDIRFALMARGVAQVPVCFLSREGAEKLFPAGDRDLAERQRQVEAGKAGAGVLAGATVDLRVRMKPRAPLGRTANVIGMLPGTTRKGEYVVVGAHHDHLGRGGYGSLALPGQEGQVHPGADDNASGVAGLLALARQLASGPPLERSVVFVAFGAEEYGQEGSTHFLGQALVPRERIAAMVNLNMIGRAQSGELRVEGCGSGEGLEAMVLGAATGLRAKPRTVKHATVRGDHARFLRAGIPSLLVHTGLHDQYHCPTDVAALVEVEEAMEVVRLVRGIIEQLAAGQRLRFHKR